MSTKRFALAVSIVITSIVLLTSAIAYGHILAVGGAVNFDDQPFINMVQQLAAAERAIYESERANGCTVFFESSSLQSNAMKGPGYTIILRPTGDSGDIFPDWSQAFFQLDQEVGCFGVEQAMVDTPCECREYLHIIGFSDGASTIGGWLNGGAPNVIAGTDFLGVIALIDVVRVFECISCAGNTNTNATWLVNPLPPDRAAQEYLSFRNKTPGFPFPCGIIQSGWVGHRILNDPTPWFNSPLVDQGVCHTDFPNDPNVVFSLIPSIVAATTQLIQQDLFLENCTCPIPGDLNGDNNVDGRDIQCFTECFITGTSAASCEAADIDGDMNIVGDVDDLQQFVSLLVEGSSPVCP